MSMVFTQSRANDNLTMIVCNEIGIRVEDSEGVELFHLSGLPASVAEATAKAFNDAMQQVRAALSDLGEVQ